jgi:hypothetical protein
MSFFDPLESRVEIQPLCCRYLVDRGQQREKSTCSFVDITRYMYQNFDFRLHKGGTEAAPPRDRGKSADTRRNQVWWLCTWHGFHHGLEIPTVRFYRCSMSFVTPWLCTPRAFLSMAVHALVTYTIVLREHSCVSSATSTHRPASDLLLSLPGSSRTSQLLCQAMTRMICSRISGTNARSFLRVRRVTRTELCMLKN